MSDNGNSRAENLGRQIKDLIDIKNAKLLYPITYTKTEEEKRERIEKMVSGYEERHGVPFDPSDEGPLKEMYREEKGSSFKLGDYRGR
jgi:hypothetical protein